MNYKDYYNVEAEITLLTTEEGGRVQGFCSGYRCTVDAAGSYWVASFYLQDRDWLYPGETARVFVRFTEPHIMLKHLTLETPLLLREGGHLVGHGRINVFLNTVN